MQLVHGDAIYGAPIQISRALHTTVDASYFRGRGGVSSMGERLLWEEAGRYIMFVGVLRSHFPFGCVGISLFVGVPRSFCCNTALCVRKEKRKGNSTSHKSLQFPFSPPPQVAPPSGAKFKRRQVNTVILYYIIMLPCEVPLNKLRSIVTCSKNTWAIFSVNFLVANLSFMPLTQLLLL